MLQSAMDARVAHIEQLENITEMCSVLDGIEEEVEEIAAKNRLIGGSSGVTSKTVAQCCEIAKHLDEINLFIEQMSRVLHTMDIKTLGLLKNSI